MYIVVRATEGKRTIGGGRGQARCCSALKRGSKSRTAWHGEGNRKQQWRQWRMYNVRGEKRERNNKGKQNGETSKRAPRGKSKGMHV